jgi:hypothetical protein
MMLVSRQLRPEAGREAAQVRNWWGDSSNPRLVERQLKSETGGETD